MSTTVQRREPLSARQCAVLQRLGRGMLPVGVARELGLDEETVKTHLNELEPLDPATGTTEPAAGDTARSA